MALTLRVTQPPPTCSEHELVAAVRSGDDRAFEELYSRYRSRIGSYIFGMVGDYGRAEDIAQEVFISALRRLQNTERLIAFKPWIYEIAKNACIDEFRRTRRTREVPLDPDEESETVERGLFSRAPTPDIAVESKQQLDDLRGAFGGLSANHHKILVMRELEGLSYTEIGERMGMSRPAVESTLFRARRRLGEEYGELVSGRRCEEVQAMTATADSRSLRALGIRQRRQLARHLAHCQPCRRHAHMAGFDDSILKTPSLAQRIAALLPIPWLRWRRGGGDEDAVAASGSHQLAAMQSLQTVSRFADPTGPSLGFGRAAAAAAALAIAGAGGGYVTGLVGHGASPRAPARVGGPATGAHHASSAVVSSAGARAVASRRSGSSASTPGGSKTPASGSSTQTPSPGGPSVSGSTGGVSSTAKGLVTSVLPKSPPATGSIAGKGSGLGGVHLPLGGLPTGAGTSVPSVPGASSAVQSVVSKTVSGVPSLPAHAIPGIAVPKVGLPAIPPVALPPVPPVGSPHVPPLPDPGSLLPGLTGQHGG
jgi:RNA polymerase sigma factor (sigma-70 family)